MTNTFTIIDAWREAVARRGLLWPPTRSTICVKDLWPEYEEALLEAHASLLASTEAARLATEEGQRKEAMNYPCGCTTNETGGSIVAGCTTHDPRVGGDLPPGDEKTDG